MRTIRIIKFRFIELFGNALWGGVRRKPKPGVLSEQCKKMRRISDFCHPEQAKRVEGSSHYHNSLAEFRCEDPSTPFHSAQDDILGRLYVYYTLLAKIVRFRCGHNRTLQGISKQLDKLKIDFFDYREAILKLSTVNFQLSIPCIYYVKLSAGTFA